MDYQKYRNSMESLGDIRLFVAAARLGGLAQAGRKLGVSPAAASARLLKLEASLSTRLFERTTRSLRLTDEGRLYLDHCEQALHALDDARAALQAGKKEIQGKVRISTTSDFGRNVLNPWLNEFITLHPKVVPALLLSDSLSNLVNDDIDLVIRFGIPPDSSLIARPLADNRRVLCASPTYLRLRGTPRHPSELGGFDHIVSGQRGWSSEWRFRRGKQEVLFNVPTETARETNDGALARQWAIEGHGIVLKSVWDVSSDLLTGRLVHLMPDWVSPDAPVHALYPRSRYMAPRVRALLGFLTLRFSEAAILLHP
jgi:DNA-binding transcriptional LysR family regulator